MAVSLPHSSRGFEVEEVKYSPRAGAGRAAGRSVWRVTGPPRTDTTSWRRCV